MARLTISNRRIGNVVILDVAGALILGEETIKFRDSVAQIVDDGSKKILANMERVDYVDSSGIGELVSAHAMAGRSGANLKLFGLPARLQGLLQMSKLITVFETFDTETDAVRSFTLHRANRRPA